MPTQEDVLFGKVAIKNKLVDEMRVKRCMALIEKEGNGKALGRFMVEKGLLSVEQYRAIEAHVKKMKAGGGPAGEKKPAGGRPAAGAGGPRRGPPKKDVLAPSGKGITVAEIEARDFSDLAEKPLDEYLRTLRELDVSDLHFQVDSPP
ncbi:MAG: hypothetical protein AAF488_05460, partial [Planctomycetota bacterium]